MKISILALLAFRVVAVRIVEKGGMSMESRQNNHPHGHVPSGFKSSCDDNVFTVMNWNIYLMDQRVEIGGHFTGKKDDGQDERPPHIAAYVSKLTREMCLDVVVFNEAWQHTDWIIDLLKEQLPYNTAGWLHKASPLRLSIESGGVFMMSRHPLEYASHWFPYNDAADTDNYVYKGFGVIRVQKGNRHHWVVGTHTQSFKDHHELRTAQMKEMRKTLDDVFNSDPWYFAGDFNMDYSNPSQGQGEVEHFMSLFDLSLPDQVDSKHGNYTWLVDNAFNAANYPDAKWQNQWLDFVFHNKPAGLKHAKGVTLDAVSETFFQQPIHGNWQESNVLSDHQPVVGRFEYETSSGTYSDAGMIYKPCESGSQCLSGFCKWSGDANEKWELQCRPSEGWGYGRYCWREADCQSHMYCDDTDSHCWDNEKWNKHGLMDLGSDGTMATDQFSH